MCLSLNSGQETPEQFTAAAGGARTYSINERDAGCSQLDLILPFFSSVAFTFTFTVSRLDVAFIFCHCHACRGSPCCTVDPWKLRHLTYANGTSSKPNRTHPAFERAILCLAWSRCSELHMFGCWDLRVSTCLVWVE